MRADLPDIQLDSQAMSIAPAQPILQSFLWPAWDMAAP